MHELNNTNQLPIVIYISGEGRSGSTLLDRVLGEVDSFISCGEMWLAWDRAFGENQLCGCGLSFSECGFWTEVVSETKRRKPDFNAGHVGALQKKIMRIRYIPYLIYPVIRPKKYDALLKEYKGSILPLYLSILSVSGKAALIDSSKMPLYALVLRAIGIDIRVIHLVRNSEAVMHSWSRKRQRPEITERIEHMPQYTPESSAYNWTKANILSELLCKNVEYSTRLKYERFTQEPLAELREIMVNLNLQASHLPSLEGNSIELGSNHIISGNPMRFKRGVITIHQDDEWRRASGTKASIMVKAITWPLMKRYGYK